MLWDRNTDRSDPALGSYSWKRIRKYWRTLRRPCWRCGQPINYSVKWPHPASLVVGHIVSRAEGRARGWSEAMLNALSNTAPEHVACSNRSGAKLGRELQDKTPPAPLKPFAPFADRW
jgi:5-methylcytosine-specific restriction endonuclease McrA